MVVTKWKAATNHKNESHTKPYNSEINFVSVTFWRSAPKIFHSQKKTPSKLFMDNKRKVVSSLVGKGSSKLRKVSLNAFDSGEEDQGDKTISGSTASTTRNPESSSTAAVVRDVGVVDEEQKEVISKTALWIFSNPDKASVLLEKSKSNPTLAFLSDVKGETAAGRLYMKELERCRTEREVQAICSGVQPVPVAAHVTTAQIASFINQNKLTGNITTVTAASSSGSSSIHVTTEVPRERRNRWGPAVAEACNPVPAFQSERMKVPAPPPHSTQHTQPSETETEEIARLAAGFDRSAPQEDQERLQRLLQEQREMQLLEGRIRDAAAQSLTGGGAGQGRNVTEVAKFLTQHAKEGQQQGELLSRKGPELLIAEQQAALYLERLAQYEDLARLDDDKYRDTVEECERNRGVIEGGTWEHRKRAKEMLQTAGKNLELTLLGAGKHHLADYLPPEVLQSFLSNAAAVTSSTNGLDAGTELAGAINAVDAHKIAESNVGYQLLRRSGWAEGAGLGAQGTGIVAPISAMGAGAVVASSSSSSSNMQGGAGRTSSSSASAGSVVISGGRGPDGAGLGMRATHEVGAEDSEFDQYRKRMMLAYRFRPNPLNNPRRNYY